MINVKKIKNIVMLVFLIIIYLTTNEGTLAYLLSKTSPVTSVFIPYEYSTGNLTINKKIEHSLGEEYAIPSNIEFDFQINLGSYYANQTINTSQGDVSTDENGIINLKVKANSKVTINNIDEETEVIVKEMTRPIGFTTKTTEEKTTISSTGDNFLEILSQYNPSSAYGTNITLNGIKYLEGRKWQEGDNFSFILEYQNELKEWENIGTKTIIYDKENIEFNKYSFTEIIQSFVFNNATTYKFRISEVIGDLENIDYDKTINYFEIIITDEDMNGTLEIKEIKTYQNIKMTEDEAKYNISVTFNNTYKTEEIPNIEYVDNEAKSKLIENNIIVRDTNYTIATVLSRFASIGSNYTYQVYDRDNIAIETDLVRTGDYIKIETENNEYIYTMVLSGDVSGDGEINYLDYVKVYNHIQKIKNPESTKNELYDEYLLAADVSDEGKITYLDYVKIYNKIKELKGDAN